MEQQKLSWWERWVATVVVVVIVGAFVLLAARVLGFVLWPWWLCLAPVLSITAFLFVVIIYLFRDETMYGGWDD